jgi:hypothetical protein
VLNELVLVNVTVLALLGDNPMQSEFACHIGMLGKFFCRICKVHGKDAINPSTVSAGSDNNSETSISSVSTASSASLLNDDLAHKPTRKKAVETLSDMVDRVTRFLKVSQVHRWGVISTVHSS